jgi:eukaryotic-like serine/threonine-protein kinase
VSAPLQILGGRYEVAELIGRGGMAEVHKGHDTRLGRPVAIKLLRSDLARDPTFLTRFKREAQSAAGLNHASIVAVYDSGDEVVTESGGAQHDVPYIVMEYVPGRTLRTVLTEDGPFEPTEAARVTEGVLDALSYSHRMGIVHRDIKPANVMIAEDGSVKVMDFGIARAIADTSATMTQTQAVMGTAQYLSPEQAQGQTVDARSDLYSTGCMLFELLTGRTPFVGESPVSIAYQHVGEKPPLAGELAPNDLAPELDAVILHSLAKRREDRYQDATSFRTDLQSARMGRSVSAAAWTDLERYRAELGSPLTARNGATAVAGAAGAAAGAAAARAHAAGVDDARETEVYSAVTGRGGQPTEVVPTAAMAAQGRPVAYRQEPDTSAMAPVPDREEERSRGLGWLWGALAALAVVAIMWFAITNLLGTDDGQDDPPLVTVPSVVDRTIEQATTQLVGLDLRVDRVDTADDAPAGTVLDQDPEAGAEVEVGSTVRLTVSTGPGLVSVPTLTGMTESQARAALVNARLTVGEVTRVDNSTEPAGTVVGQSPSAGSTVEPESVVSLQLSSGRMSVPNVIGLRQSEAQNALADRNLAYEVTFRESSEFEQGTVLDQDPRTGLVDQGTTVNLVVAQAPTPTPTTPSPEPTPTEEPTEEPTPTETEED